MGKKMGAIPRKRVNFYVDEIVLAQLQLIYYDAARGRSKYGAMSEIVNMALKEHLDRVTKEQNNDSTRR